MAHKKSAGKKGPKKDLKHPAKAQRSQTSSLAAHQAIGTRTSWWRDLIRQYNRPSSFST